MAQRVVQVGEVQLCCEVRGTGVPLVLIHGFPFDHTMWGAQIEDLSEVCQVIAPDLRGFGGSSLTEANVVEGIEMRRYALDIKAILDELGVDEPAILCGFSMGGYVLWQLALEFSECVRAIVLCDTRADADSAEGSQAREKMAADVLREGTDVVPNAILPRLLAAGTLSERSEIVDAAEAMIRQSPSEAIAAAQRGMACRPDVSGRLSEISRPALVVVGVEDAISPPAYMREIARALPTAEFVEIANAGHMSPLENPTAVNESIRRFVQLQ